MPSHSMASAVDAAGVAVPLRHSVSPFNSVNEVFPQ